MSEQRGKKRFLAISEEIIANAMEVSEKVGIPFTVLIERILSDVLRMMKYNSNFSEVIAYADSLNDIMRLGGAVLPWELTKKAIEGMSEEHYKSILMEMEKISSWYAELSKVKRGPTPAEFKKAIQLFLPSSNVDVIEDGKALKFVISINDASERLISLITSVINGLVKGFSLEPIEISKGDSLVVAKLRGFHERE